MLHEWLAPMPVQDFVARHLGRLPHARPGSAARTVPPFSARPDFGCVRRETSPLLGALLIPGDWLYIPRRWWHLVRSIEDSLSISIGVFPHGLAAARAQHTRSAAEMTGGAARRSCRPFLC